MAADPVKKNTPVVLFAYNRLSHLKRTIDALKESPLALTTPLRIYSDGPKSDRDFELVKTLRAYLQKVDGFASVDVVERDENLGLATSIIKGVTETIDHYGQVIVLEDDVVTSPGFLEYMNRALTYFEEDDRVASIHGYVYPAQKSLPEAFFLRGADCWGWGTWKRGWGLFREDGSQLISELTNRKLISTFNMDGCFPYFRMLQDQVAGKNDSWAIRWHASVFLAGKLTLYPGQSLVQNIGLDNSGTHCGASEQYGVSLSSRVPAFESISVQEDLPARETICDYLRHIQPEGRGILKYLKGLLRLKGKK